MRWKILLTWPVRNPEHMYCVVVGDAESQLEPLKSLGLGSPVLVEPSKSPVWDDGKRLPLNVGLFNFGNLEHSLLN
jgi:hypothetical protein